MYQTSIASFYLLRGLDSFFTEEKTVLKCLSASHRNPVDNCQQHVSCLLGCNIFKVSVAEANGILTDSPFTCILEE